MESFIGKTCYLKTFDTLLIEGFSIRGSTIIDTQGESYPCINVKDLGKKHLVDYISVMDFPCTKDKIVLHPQLILFWE
jgi:hypothetical protein